MVGQKFSLARYLLLLSILSVFLAAGGSRIAHADITQMQLDSIINSSINNPVVVADITSNAYVSTYLIDNPQTLGYFANDSLAVDNVLTNPLLLGIDANSIALVGFLNNPSFGIILQNVTQFDDFLAMSSLSAIVNNQTQLASLLSNPTLATLVMNSTGLSNLLTNQSFTKVSGDPAALTALLANPALSSFALNSTAFTAFLSSASAATLISNPTAFANLLANPTLTGVITSSGFAALINSTSLTTLLATPSFVTFIANPAFGSFVTGNSITSILSNPTALINLLDNPQLSVIVGNSTALASLLGNSNLAGILANDTGLVTLVSSSTFLTAVASNPASLTTLLGNPTLGTILSNPTSLITFLGTSSLASIVSNPAALTVLFSNPSLSSVISNPVGLGEALATQNIDTVLGNATVFATFLSSPSLTTIISNPAAFGQILGASQLSSVLGNSTAMIGLINNPSLGSILLNPAQFTSFLSTGSISSIIGNPAALTSLLGNPSLSGIIGNPAGLASLITTPGLTGIFSNTSQLTALIGNPSLLGIMSNSSSLTSFLSNPSFGGIIGNFSELTGLLSNSGLSTILGNQGALASVIGNPALSDIISDPTAFAGLLSNPSFASILANPAQLTQLTGQLSSLLGNGALGIITSNPAALGALLSNPSLSSILSNPAGLTSLLSNPALLASGFLSSGALTGLLGNGALGSILGNPATLSALTSLLSSGTLSSIFNSQTFTSILSNPAALTGLLSNIGLGSLINNPALSNLLSGASALGNLVGGPLGSILGSGGLLGSLLGNSGLGSLLGASGLGSTLGGISGLGGGIGGLLGDSGVSGLLGNSQIGGLLGGGLGGVGIPGLGSGIPGLGACPTSTPEFGICNFVTTSQVTTSYSGVAGNGQIFQLPTVTTQSPTPLISSVLSTNKQNGQWLITCPTNPNPMNSMEYFTTDAQGFIAGNRCLANAAPLLTVVTLYTNVFWTWVTPATGSSFVGISNMANGWTSDIAYSGETVTEVTAVTSSPSSTTTNTGTTTPPPTVAPGQCPNTNYQGQGGSLSFAQVEACAENAGFSGTSLIQIVSMAYQESSFRPGATGAGTTGGCSAEGILQEGQCGAAGEAYPLPDYSPTSCSTYTAGNWASIYYNPTCAFQWAYAFITDTNTGSPALTCGAADPYCFWGSYLSGAYCKYAPDTYSGYDCAQGQNLANFPWGSCTTCTGGGATTGPPGGGGSGISSPEGQQINISNGYDSQSYIYGQVPASNQHGLWSWAAKYANLANTNLGQLQFSKSIPNLQLLIPGLCLYSYDYSITSMVTNIANTNITVPQYNVSAVQNDDWLNFSGYIFSPTTQLGQDSCFDQLSGGAPACGGWTKIGNNGSVDVDGDIYTGLNVYYGSSSYSDNPRADYKESLIAVYQDGYDEVNAMAFDDMNLSLVPFLTYIAGVPSSYTQINTKPNFMNLSYNLYSTHNYMNPGNSLDEFSLFSDSALFGEYNGYLAMFPLNSVALLNPDPNSLSSPQGNFLSEYSEKQAKIVEFGQGSNGNKPILLGNYVIGQIHNPAYIAAAPNGYVYVVNYSTTSCWYCVTSTTRADLFIFKFIPQGYYNLSGFPVQDPGNVVQGQSNLKTWNAAWESYAANAFYEDSQSFYLMGIDPLSITTKCVFSICTFDKGGILHDFIPLAVQPDDNGDLFILGAHTGGLGGQGGFKLAGLNPPGSSDEIWNDSVNKPAGFYPSGEFAASPGGQFVYAANTAVGNVEVYETDPSGVKEGGTDTFIYSNAIQLSYSNSTFNLNIAAYLAQGGPYNDSDVASSYQSYSSSPVYDTAAQHHPVAIVDSKGILYVVDNWTFTVGGAQSSILMLRAFGENGTEIPIDPTLIDDFVSTQPGVGNGGINIGGVPQGTVQPTYGWKPYGWPLAANISLPGGGSVSYCSYDCTYGPYDTNSAYPPIGPRIDGLGNVGNGANSVATLADFNGTIYMIAHPWSFSNGGAGGYATNPLYAELLVMHPSIQNYTKISYLDNASYQCYINVTPSEASPCIYTVNSSAILSNLYPPVLGVPSAFSYVESLGGPEQYLNVQTALSSLFPSGISSNSYQSNAQSELNSGLSGEPNYQNLATTSPSGNQIAANKLATSYLKSNIYGYVVTPYNTTIKTTQKWYNIHELAQFSPLPCPPFPLASKTSTKTSFNYIKTQLTQGNPLNISIEGGDPYLQYLPLENDYVQNISDQGLIIPPYLNYQIFTNRLFGEMFINQTISPQTASQKYNARSGLPVVINAIRVYNYNTLQFQQISSLGTFAAYNAQGTVPINIVKGANCGGSCSTGLSLFGGKYYYGSKYFTGISNITYINQNNTKFFSLFEVFKQAAHVGSSILNLSRENSMLGYNRLVYTFVDRFNNTIYMPLDVDFANITKVTVSTATIISPTNANETTVSVHGTANYTTYTGVHPLPAGSKIYLYWNTNLNYYNNTSTPTSNPNSYYAWALRCAIVPSSKACQLANPLSTQTQQQPNGADEAKQVDYHANAGGNCPMQPNSLLQPIVYNCNIYGSAATNIGNANTLPTIRTDPNDPSDYQYCVPFFPNGTGLFTSQLGLIGVVQTDANGNFNSNSIAANGITACGVGQNRIIAYYYGNPGPEPINVSQTWLGASGGIGEFAAKIDPTDAVNTLEFNYDDAPNSSTASFEIGSYALNFGVIGIIEIAVLIVVVAAIIIKSATGKKKRRR